MLGITLCCCWSPPYPPQIHLPSSPQQEPGEQTLTALESCTLVSALHLDPWGLLAARLALGS